MHTRSIAYGAEARTSVRRPTLLQRIALWVTLRRERRALMRLSDAHLKDIGLGRSEAYREAVRPFWDADEMQGR